MLLSATAKSSRDTLAVSEHSHAIPDRSPDSGGGGMPDPTAGDSHRERCHTVGELRDVLADFPDDRPLSIDHDGVELENVTVHNENDRVVIY